MNKSRYCSFYVSDVHLITMLLPYINEKMKEGKEFITIFEEDISESAKRVIKSVSLKRKEEQAFINIGWKNKTDLEELSKVNLENKFVLVMGSDSFIEDVNKKLHKLNSFFTIINCFEVFQAEKIIDDIVENHEKLINSRGENEINKIFTQCTKKSNKKITIIE